jgi:antitoxin VapB
VIVMARLFRSNRSQAVRLPKEQEFPSTVSEVDVVTHGNVRLLVPRKISWDEWIENGPFASDDFSVPRDEADQERDFQWD